MILYLMQHGEALPSDQDPVRPLTRKGENDVRQMAAYLRANTDIAISEVIHSGKIRARQTAEPIAASLSIPLGSDHHLKPGDDPLHWAGILRTRQKNLMLVGHMPHLQRLADLLLIGEDGKGVVNFRNAGVVCLGRQIGGSWKIEWVFTPAILPDN